MSEDGSEMFVLAVVSQRLVSEFLVTVLETCQLCEHIRSHAQRLHMRSLLKLLYEVTIDIEDKFLLDKLAEL